MTPGLQFRHQRQTQSCGRPPPMSIRFSEFWQKPLIGCLATRTGGWRLGAGQRLRRHGFERPQPDCNCPPRVDAANTTRRPSGEIAKETDPLSLAS
jgi:hypothetical protein